MSGVRIILAALAAWTVVGAVVLLWVGPILRRRAADERSAPVLSDDARAILNGPTPPRRVRHPERMVARRR